jgi:trans-aconitate methyltransferase
VLSPEEQAARLKRTASSAVTVGIAAGQSKRLLIRLRPHAVHTALDASQSAAAAAAAASAAPLDADDVTVRVQIHEVKNRDETRFVDVRARVEMVADAGCSETEPKLVDPLPHDDSIVFSSSKPS